MKKKNRFYLNGQGNWMGVYILTSMCVFLMFAISCSKEDDNTSNPPVTTVQVPVLTTSAVGSVTPITAECGGNISSNGGATVTARGVCWGTAATPTIADNKTTDGTGTGSFTSAITGLTASTTYYVRAYATNSKGTAYGDTKTFTTLPPAIQVPVLTTYDADSITSTTASCGGFISSDGGATVTDRGVCWSTTQNPTITNIKTSDGTGVDSFSSNITGLTANTTYYVRAYATNSVGTGYGNETTFNTKGVAGTLTDPRDGITYKTITIGTQVWMTENFQWKSSTFTPDWKEYNNNQSLGLVYGVLYDYNLVLKATQGITGWRVPTDNDWKKLVDYLGGNAVAGAKLKEEADADPMHWVIPNTGAKNSSGFTALGAGYYDALNALGFQDLKNKTYFWTTTLNGTDLIIYTLESADSKANREFGAKTNYYSIRLMKDL
jgi:uncharacterized protein (TIGR02145 family)